MLTGRRRDVTPSEHGFSLVELLVAMVVTLIVTGAIYGLLASGQNAFRREPLLSERQQNIRSAMDIIQADIATAGAGMPIQFQVFANGSSGAALTPDFLQMYTSDGNCPVVTAGVPTNASPVPGYGVNLDRPVPRCWGSPSARGLFAAANNTGQTMYIGMATLGSAVSPAPTPSGLVFDANGTPLSTCNIAQPCTMTLSQNSGPVPTDFVMPIKVIRYEIANASATDTAPCLWRSETGGRDISTSAGTFYAASTFNPAGNWRLVARGIKNMKVAYVASGTALPAASPTPGNPPAMPSPAATPDTNNVVRSVIVTLTAQTEMQLQAGRRVSPYQADLTSVTTPRAALANLGNIGGALQWH